MKVNCTNCKKEIDRKPSYIKRTGNLCCSKECALELRTTKPIKTPCATCGKEVIRTQYEMTKSKTGNVFCDHSCSAKFSNENRGGYGIHNYRSHAFKAYANECNSCGYNKVPEVLQVHHIDRNRKNSDVSNLVILCPTCHAEEHFKSKDGSFWNVKE